MTIEFPSRFLCWNWIDLAHCWTFTVNLNFFQSMFLPRWQNPYNNRSLLCEGKVLYHTLEPTFLQIPNFFMTLNMAPYWLVSWRIYSSGGSILWLGLEGWMLLQWWSFWGSHIPCTHFPSPGFFSTHLRRAFLPFIWHDKHPRLSYDILRWNKLDGGIGLPDIALYYKAMALVRILN